ncbi:MAG: tyrosine-type recombinase/integrase [Planctomycetes bacterium]|nr:tyrosine-type recombinase/integrase [Planctomycetota bacterium]
MRQRRQKISVSVIEMGRKYHQMRWHDLRNGQVKTRSTGILNDGKARSRKEAERVAATFEAELQARRADFEETTWDNFRERYETEALRSLAATSEHSYGTVFDMVERIIKPRDLTDLTERAISQFAATLRDTTDLNPKRKQRGPRSEATIKSYLAHLKAALRWAERQKLLDRAPHIDMPKRAKGSKVMKGRPITLEEFERLLTKVGVALFPAPKGKPPRRAGVRNEQQYQRLVVSLADDGHVGPRLEADSYEALGICKAAGHTPQDLANDIEEVVEVIESWRHFLRGLWLSGLRLAESLELYWDRNDKLSIELDGRRPMLRIPAGLEKGNRDRILPVAPEFAEFLLATPKADRHGPIFKPRSQRANRTETGYVGDHKAGARIASMGKAAGVKVSTSGKLKFASAHDLRRSFGERWASRVMPQILMELMRHESIETTMRYYVGRNAERTANVLWEAHELAGQSSSALSSAPVPEEGGNPDNSRKN